MATDQRRSDEVDILVVEDSATQAQQLSYLLQQHGYAIRIASNGRRALEEIGQKLPTIIITDIVMPEMDGYALCSAIKGDAELQDIPVIMVTSLSGVQDIAKSLECGADNFIRKPYDPRTLLTRIEYILVNRELRKSSKVQMGMEVFMGGKKHFISSGREQIVDLLISTYEEAVQMNEELQIRQREIALSNSTLRALYRIAADMNKAATEAEVCELGLRGTLDLPSFRSGWIFLDNGGDGLRTAATCGLPDDLQAPGALERDCLCWQMLRSGELRRGAAVIECKLGADACGMNTHVSVPLTVGNECLGIMNIAGPSGGTFSTDDLRMLEAVGSQVATSVQRARLYQHLEALVEQRTAALQAEVIERTRAERNVANLNRIYAVLSGINTTIVRVHDKEVLFKEVCRIAVNLGKFRLAWIGQVLADGAQIKPVAWMCEERENLEDSFNLSAVDALDCEKGLFAEALQGHVAATCNNLSNYGGEVFPANAREHGCRAMAVFPIQLQGRTVATLALYASESNAFDDMELELLKELAGDVSFALEYIQKSKQVDYLAYYDVLTGLPNRTLILDRLTQLLQGERYDGEARRPVSLLLINVERFRNINESFGRRIGDALLKLVANRLCKALASTDHVARTGSDHFAAILVDVGDAEEIAHLLDDVVLPGLGKIFDIEGHELHIAFRFGIAMFPNDGNDAETMIANAETTLRKAGSAQERYLFYAPQMNARVLERLSLENKLHRALETGAFVLHYQPKVNLNSGSICGMEALIRWNDPESGLVSPAKFVPILEETGLIVDVGRWAIEQAISDHAAWRTEGLQPPRVAVNVSVVQIRRKDFPQILEQMLAARGNEGDFLDLELTESLLMADIDTNVERLGLIRGMGIKVAIDDFGTGYSSLSYLKRFPIDFLKIDASFVREVATNPDAAAICIAVISLAHSLRLTVIAEGVETESQMSYLRRHQCDEIQGYFFSRPLPADELAGLLREGRTLALPEGLGERRKSLLIIDDEPNILSALRRALRPDGYEIHVAQSAQEGFDILAKHEVQVILSDQRMPAMSGTEFLSRVKDLYPNTIRIVLSGYTDLEAITSAVNRGAIYRFLTKPWEDDQLREHVREAFRHQDAGK